MCFLWVHDPCLLNVVDSIYIDLIIENYFFNPQVARGNCFLKLVDGKLERIECVIYALKKFTGGLGDDDDRQKGDNNTWKCYFTKVHMPQS